MPHHDHTDRTDDELVAAFAAGEARAFREIVRRYERSLFLVAWRWAKNEHDARDILQDALFKAARALPRFRGEARLSTWLHRLVANAAYDHVYRRPRRESLTLDGNEKAPLDTNARLSYDPFPRADLGMELGRALRAINPHQAAALLLVDAHGHTVETAAHREGVRPGTVKSRRSRGRERLRRALALGE